MEWWYFNGHLAGREGDEYSFHFVGFHLSGVEGVPLGLTARVMHLTLASPEDGALVKESRGALGKGSLPEEGFAVAIGDWRIEGGDGKYRLAAPQLDLQLTSTKEAMLHDGNGLVDLGPGGESFYYTYGRLSAHGELTAGGEARQVSGEGWMDHQWGEIASARVGWDWFSFQLLDGVEAMVFSVWDYDSRELVAEAGTLVDSEGGVLYLSDEEIDIASLGEWTSPRTGIVYPSGWRVSLEPVGLDLEVQPTHPDAEFDVEAFNPLAYWEGQVALMGERDGKPVSGRGFVELVGYDRRGLGVSPPPPPGG